MKNAVFILTTLFCISLITGSSCNKKSESNQDQTQNKLTSYEVKLTGEAARRRDIQKKYLFRLQCGRNKNNEGFEDWEKDLIGYCAYRHEPSYYAEGERLLCQYTGVGKVLESALIYAWDEQDNALKDRWDKVSGGKYDYSQFLDILHKDVLYLFHGYDKDTSKKTIYEYMNSRNKNLLDDGFHKVTNLTYNSEEIEEDVTMVNVKSFLVPIKEEDTPITKDNVINMSIRSKRRKNKLNRPFLM